VPRLLAIERDRRFHPALQMLQEAAGDRLAVVYADALQADDAALAAVPPPLTVSTSLLKRSLKETHVLAGPSLPGKRTTP